MKQNTRTSRLVGSALALVLAAAVPACLDASDEPTDAPIATLAASTASTSSLGITAWEVRAEGDAFRLIGRSAAGERKAELVTTTLGEQIAAQVEYPETGSLVLSRDGVVKGASSPVLAQVGAAVTADVGTNTHPIAPETAPAGGGFGTATSASTLFFQGRVEAGWSLWSYSMTQTVGIPSCFPSRSNYAARSDFYYNGMTGSFCYGTQWWNDTKTDCRFQLRFDVPAQTKVGCNWSVYTN